MNVQPPEAPHLLSLYIEIEDSKNRIKSRHACSGYGVSDCDCGSAATQALSACRRLLARYSRSPSSRVDLRRTLLPNRDAVSDSRSISGNALAAPNRRLKSSDALI